MRPLVSMRDALRDPDIFGSILGDDSWAAWKILLVAAMGEELTDEERLVFESLTGRATEPAERVDELWAAIGRRGGKTRAVATLAAFTGALCDWSHVLAPGERATLPIMSASVHQAGKCKQYISGIFDSVPALKGLVTNETSDTISLSTRVDIECRPASFRTIRGGTAVGVICDEIAFWRSDESQNPDAEILNAVRPALATTGGMIACISSPYARRGVLWEAFKRDYGPDGDASVLVAKAASRAMNPGLSEKVVARAYERDPAAAAAEYGGEFRTDVESFINREIIDACTDKGCGERPPMPRPRYVGFVDPSGGSSDSMTAAVAHMDGETVVLDAIRERKAPFNPTEVTAEFAGFFSTYRIGVIHGDRYAGEWPREAFARHGITYKPAELSRSELYLALLPSITSRRARLLDDERLAQQLIGLERRTSRAGRDSIDHAPGAHDDRANAVAGAIVTAAAQRPGARYIRSSHMAR